MLPILLEDTLYIVALHKDADAPEHKTVVVVVVVEEMIFGSKSFP